MPTLSKFVQFTAISIHIFKLSLKSYLGWVYLNLFLRGNLWRWMDEQLGLSRATTDLGLSWESQVIS